MGIQNWDQGWGQNFLQSRPPQFVATDYWNGIVVWEKSNGLNMGILKTFDEKTLHTKLIDDMAVCYSDVISIFSVIWDTFYWLWF